MAFRCYELSQKLVTSILIAYFLCLSVQTVASNVAVIDVTDTRSSVRHCILYNPLFHEIPSYEHSKLTPIYELLDLSSDSGCDDANKPNMSGKAVALKRGNCSFTQKALLVSQNHGSVILIVSKKQINIPAANESSEYNKINITVAMIQASVFADIQKLNTPQYVRLYGAPSFDPSVIIMLILAISCVAIGSFWSAVGCVPYLGDSVEAGDVNNCNDDDKVDERNDKYAPTITPVILGFLVIFTTGFILLLYFFYSYLVYMVIALFCIGGSLALYNCLLPLWDRLPPYKKFVVYHREFTAKNVVLLAICCCVGIFWAVQRHESYAWVLQDLLGVSFCVFAIKSVNIASFKLCTILLSCLFVYDVFFVFITPYFTSDGKSIMVEVATGGGGSGTSRERIPLLLSIPKILVCHGSMSMLGFGDVVIPGVAIAYCWRFDRMVKARPIYTAASLLAYTVGLIATGVALYAMKSGQPALLYIVPSVLVTALAVAACRREIKPLWSGKIVSDRPALSNDDPVTTDEAAHSTSDVSDAADESNNLINRKTSN